MIRLDLTKGFTENEQYKLFVFPGGEIHFKAKISVKKGLLKVIKLDTGNLVVKDQCTWKQEKTGVLETVFKDGKLVKVTTLDEIRTRLNKTI